MLHQKETAGPVTGNGGLVMRKVVATSIYQTPDFNAKGFAPLIIAARFRLPLPLAHVVCELAGIGGRHHG